MISQIFDHDIFNVLTVMSLSMGSRFQREELKKRTRMNNVALDNALLALLNSGIIKKEKKYLLVNFENKHAKQVLDVVLAQYKELKEIPLNAYFSVIDMVLFLSRFKNNEVYLFGSYAKLIFKDSSDIDLAVISEAIDKKAVSRAMQKAEKRYGKEIEMHYFEKNFYKNKKDPLVLDILKNGTRLI